MEVKRRTRRNLFGMLSPEQLEQQVAPGKNRLIYLWTYSGDDGLLPLLALANASSGTRHNIHFETG